MKAALAILLLFIASPLVAQEAAPQDAAKDLDKIEAELKAKPEEPELHAKKCQALFAAGKEQEAIDHGAVAMSKYIAAGNNQASIKLGSLKTKTHRVDVVFNMGKKERAKKREGIVRPYSFLQWTDEKTPKLVRTIDFELGCFGGEVATAAVGETTRQGHFNFGIVDPASDFATIKKKALEVLAD